VPLRQGRTRKRTGNPVDLGPSRITSGIDWGPEARGEARVGVDVGVRSPDGAAAYLRPYVG
jgi:hypothetical protein